VKFVFDEYRYTAPPLYVASLPSNTVLISDAKAFLSYKYIAPPFDETEFDTKDVPSLIVRLSLLLYRYKQPPEAAEFSAHFDDEIVPWLLFALM
jgi:hypothetical protein